MTKENFKLLVRNLRTRNNEKLKIRTQQALMLQKTVKSLKLVIKLKEFGGSAWLSKCSEPKVACRMSPSRDFHS